MVANKYNSIIRSKVLHDFSKGLNQKEISLTYLVHKSTICRIIKSADINVSHKGGRARLTTAREDRKEAVFFLRKTRLRRQKRLKII